MTEHRKYPDIIAQKGITGRRNLGSLCGINESTAI
jgi:hypothetical protein